MRERIPLALLLAFAAPAQSPALQARLEGQVVDPLHEPVANAEVVVEHDGVVVATTRSDGNGTFVFPRVPAQFVVVRATTDAPDIGAVLIDLWGEGRGFAQIRTMPARKLSGTVRDDAGAPVAGAWVLASPASYQPIALAHCRCRSDDAGKYELTHVAMGAVNVRAWSPDNDADAFAGSIGGHDDTALDCIVTRDAADWWTFLLEDATVEQRARAELRVMAFNRREQVPLPRELARPRAVTPGKWELRGWTRADMIYAWVELDGATMWPGTHVIQPGVGSTKRRFRIGDPDGAICGGLKQADGNPAVGIALLVQPLGLGAVNSLRRAVLTDAEGRFAVQSPVGTDERFALRSMSPSTVLVGNDANPVWYVANHFANQKWELETRAAHSIRLHFEDLGGTPAAGTRVTLSTETGGANRVVGSGISSLDGSIEISCLSLDLPAQLEITAQGPAGLSKVQAQALAGTETYCGRHRLHPAASLRGLIVDADGKPIPGARPSVTEMSGDRGTWALATDRAGRFHLRGLTPGNYLVSVRGLRTYREMIQLEAGETAESTLSVIE